MAVIHWKKGCFKWLKVASAVLWMLGMVGMVSNGVMINIYGLLCVSVMREVCECVYVMNLQCEPVQAPTIDYIYV